MLKKIIGGVLAGGLLLSATCFAEVQPKDLNLTWLSSNDRTGYFVRDIKANVKKKTITGNFFWWETESKYYVQRNGKLNYKTGIFDIYWEKKFSLADGQLIDETKGSNLYGIKTGKPVLLANMADEELKPFSVELAKQYGIYFDPASVKAIDAPLAKGVDSPSASSSYSSSSYSKEAARMDENFKNSWQGVVSITKGFWPLGVFAIKKQYNEPESIFIGNHLHKYTNESCNEYDYYGVIVQENIMKIKSENSLQLFFITVRVDPNGYAIVPDYGTPMTSSNVKLYLDSKNGPVYMPQRHCVAVRETENNPNVYTNEAKYAEQLFKGSVGEQIAISVGQKDYKAIAVYPHY